MYAKRYLFTSYISCVKMENDTKTTYIDTKRESAMNLKEQEYICELARCGSITKAAAQLFITQPALSTFVRNVEKSLGVDLFIRDGKQMRLTYAGELYVKNAKEMLRLKENFYREISDVRHGIKGRFNIGIQRRRCPHLAVQVILEFSRKHPEIELAFKDDDHDVLQKMFLNGELDLLLHNDVGDMGFAEAEVLMQEKILLAIPYSDPAVREGKWLTDSRYPWIDLGTLGSRTFVLPSRMQSLRLDANQLLNDAHVTPNRIIEVGNIETQLQMVAEGMGVSFTRESYAALFQYEKRPRFFTTGDPVASKPLYIIYRKEMQKQPGFAELVEIIRIIVEKVMARRLN